MVRGYAQIGARPLPPDEALRSWIRLRIVQRDYPKALIASTLPLTTSKAQIICRRR